MVFRTVDECYEVGGNQAITITVLSSVIFMLYSTLCNLMVVLNTIAYIVVIVLSILRTIPPRSILILTAIIVFELVCSCYIRASYFAQIDRFKETLQRKILEHCDEYNRMEEWERKMVDEKMAKNYMGIGVSGK